MRTLLDIELVEISLTAIPVYTATDVAIAQRSLQMFQGNGQSIRWLRNEAAGGLNGAATPD